MQVFSGTVLAVSDVTIEGQSGGLATAAGGVIGYQAGKNSGGNSSKGLRRSIGATVGANAGAAVSKRASSQAGLEIEVEMDDGRIQVIVQKKDDDFRVGDRVRVIQAGDGTLRIRQ
jgi:outer membrane lipoprotein SlyB